jgi:hypothetical protein
MPSRPKAWSDAGVAILTPSRPGPVAFEIASRDAVRPVRTMQPFHAAPVMEQATAGSTMRPRSHSAATGGMARAVPDPVGPMARCASSSPGASARRALPMSGFSRLSVSIATIVPPLLSILEPVACSRPGIRPSWLCLAEVPSAPVLSFTGAMRISAAAGSASAMAVRAAATGNRLLAPLAQ